MRGYRAAVFSLVGFTLAALPAAAQDNKTVDVTPYVAVGSEGAAPVGTAVTFPITSKLSVETDMAYRRGEGNLNFLSTNASLLMFLPRIGATTPYAVAGVGLRQYGSPVLSSSGSPIGTQPHVAPTINLGGGLKTPMNDKVSFRTDARWFKPFGRQGSEQFRVAQGVSIGVSKR